MKQTRRYGWMNIVDNLIWAVIGALIIVVVELDTSATNKIIFISVIAVFACLYMWFIYHKAVGQIQVATPIQETNSTHKKHISKIVMLNEENQVLKQWSVYGKAGVLIGRNTPNSSVDIDLSNTALEALVSDEHALLNYTNGSWYVEDNDSEQGTAVQKVGENEVIYLNKSEPMRLNLGDIIFIGKTILQVR